MNSNTVPGASAAIYSLLEPFSEQERLNIVSGVLVLFGQSLQLRSAGATMPPAVVSHHQDSMDLPLKAARWAQQAGLSPEMLESAFYLEPPTPEVIAPIPGQTAQEKTINCYLLSGAAAFLKTGEPSFVDADARALCEHVGCYDTTNHSKRLKHLGNRVVGSKGKGWKILAPGLKDAADIIKAMS